MSPEGTSAPDPILDLLGGKARAQAVSTAAAIGLPDALSEGPKHLDELAPTLGCERGALESLIRLLTGLGLFSSPEPGTYALTDVGRRLCRDALGPLATYLGAPEQWDPWSRLRDAMGGGANAFERTMGQPIYPYLAENDAAAARYDAAIDAFTRHEAEQLCQAFDFGDAQHIVDVGGGRGTLLAEILARHPEARGTLFDLPHVVERQGPALRASGRIDVAAGSFLLPDDHGIPPGADHYLVKHVLHNWPDDEAVRILEHVAQAAGPAGTILAIDAVLAPDPRPDLAALLDLEMRVQCGGRQRRKPEMRRLFQRAGLRIERLVQLTDAAWLVVARKHPSSDRS